MPYIPLVEPVCPEMPLVRNSAGRLVAGLFAAGRASPLVAVMPGIPGCAAGDYVRITSRLQARNWAEILLVTKCSEDRELTRSAALSEAAAAKLDQSAFLKACRRQPTDYVPVWLMRQAGRFMPEYREIRSRVEFLELCKNPELACQVTVMAVEMLKVDAAIIFSDILLPLEAMGVGLKFLKGDGPVIERPPRSRKEIEQLRPVDPEESLGFALEAIKLTRAALNPAVPLIGFAGAPFTLASYLLEGGASRNYENTKSLLYREPDAWHALMTRLVDLTVKYLKLQVTAGAQAVQLFDSWVGCLSQDDYREFVLPHMRTLIAGIRGTAPVIHFGTGTAHLLEMLRDAGGDVVGLDWRIGIAEAWNRLGPQVAVQGNLDPVVLLADRFEIEKRVRRIFDQTGNRAGHIFNLGHGVLPETTVDNVKYLVELVHELGRR